MADPMPTIVASSGLAADVYCATCPTRQALDRIAGKWAVLILDLLSGGALRYRALHRRIEGVSQKMLTQTLRDLVADGLVARQVFPTTPPQVEYSLTPLGASLAVPLGALREWAETHINDLLEARARHVGRVTPEVRSPSGSVA